MKNLLSLSALLIFLLTLNSCETIPKAVSLPAKRQDAVHTVAPGETFWRISKMYDVPVATILGANRLKKSQNLKMGQKLFIPNAAQIKPVISLYPSNKWQYIIIHHSATEVGNSLAFHKAHLKRGWDQGVGYHFIIDKGRSGKQDGQIEVSTRWLKQLDGAHCKASEMNSKAIGICLVGDFNHDLVTEKQLESLIYLVNTLQNYYHILDKHILGHGEVPEATTQCPGKNFPWQEFWRELKEK